METSVEPAGQQADQSTGAAGPLAAELVLGATPVLKEPRLLDGRLFWLEQLPAERGRTTLRLRTPDAREVELTPELDLRSRIHGYGGGSYGLAGDTAVVVADGGRSLWRLDLSGIAGAGRSQTTPPRPQRLTPEAAPAAGSAQSALYGDGLVDLARQRWIGVCEQDGRDRLVSVPLAGGDPSLLWESPDFCGYAVLSPCGSHLAWLSWRQPCMPWERSQLWLGRIDDQGDLQEARPIAGSAPDDAVAASVFQPLWAGSDLVVANDRSGWWNLELLEDATRLGPGSTPGWRPLLPMQAEFAMPQWVYGMRTTAWDGRQLLAAACRDGRWELGALLPAGDGAAAASRPATALSETAAAADGQGAAATEPACVATSGTAPATQTRTSADTGSLLEGPLQWRPIPLPFDDLAALAAEAGSLVAIASGPLDGPGLLELDCSSGGWRQRPAAAPALTPDRISIPQALWFSGHAGRRTHAWYYPPLGGASPASPLLVRGHSGPTAMARTGLSLTIQYWTSRGWGVVDVNYGGSTGFGRAYRERLDGGWGVVDVDDCLAAARAVVESGRADPARIAMEGSSASGFTVLAAMARGDTIRAGAIRYPVTDLTALAEGDHRFEARYFDSLVGPWPQARPLYEQRSPLQQVDRINAPLLFFHGLDDTVVQAQQSIAMVERLRQRGVPVELQLFEGEGHGFRDAAVQRQVLERSEAFFREHFGLPECA
jgi:dienelactone hydrolase